MLRGMGSRRRRDEPVGRPWIGRLTSWAVFVGAGAVGPSWATDAAAAEVVSSTTAVPAGAIELDRSVARVDREVITLSELLMEARLTLLRRGGSRAPRWLTLSSQEVEAVLAAVAGEPSSEQSRLRADFLQAELTRIVHRGLLMTEVRRLGLREVSRDELAQAQLALMRAVGGAERLLRDLDAIGFSGPRDAGGWPESVLAILRTERWVERLVKLRARALRPVTETELRRCVEERKDLLGSDPGRGELRLRTAMNEARVAERLREMLERLSLRVPVRLAPPFVAQPLPEVPACPEGWE